jgi:hypothetical protein
MTFFDDLFRPTRPSRSLFLPPPPARRPPPPAPRSPEPEPGGWGWGTARAGSCELEIPFEQKEPDYLLWAPLRSSFASSSTPAGCLLQLEHGHGLVEAARDAKPG